MPARVGECRLFCGRLHRRYSVLGTCDLLCGRVPLRCRLAATFMHHRHVPRSCARWRRPWLPCAPRAGRVRAWQMFVRARLARRGLRGGHLPCTLSQPRGMPRRQLPLRPGLGRPRVRGAVLRVRLQRPWCVRRKRLVRVRRRVDGRWVRASAVSARLLWPRHMRRRRLPMCPRLARPFLWLGRLPVGARGPLVQRSRSMRRGRRCVRV